MEQFDTYFVWFGQVLAACFSYENVSEFFVSQYVYEVAKTTQTVFGTLRTVILLLLLKQTIFLQTSLAEFFQSREIGYSWKTGDYIDLIM